MTTFELDQQLVRRHFGHAAGSYERHDVLQREVQASLLGRLDFYTAMPQRVVDVGAGGEIASFSIDQLRGSRAR